MTDDIDPEAVDLIYGAALDPSLWADALDWMADEFAAPCATIIPLAHSFALKASRGLEDAERAYAADWWMCDTMNEDLARRLYPIGPYNDWEWLTEDQISHDAFYNDFRARFGMGHMMGFIAKPHPEGLFSIGLQLAARREPPDAIQVRKFQILAGHIARSLAIACRMTALEDRVVSLAEALSALDHGAAILDHHGRVVTANAALVAMHASGVRIENRTLRCTRSADQVVLDRLIGACLSASVLPSGPDQIAIARDAGLRPLIVRGIPLGAAQRDDPTLRCGHAGHALILLIDPDRPRKPCVEQELVLLGLTRSEARVAALVGGGTPPANAAQTLNLSVETTRTMLKRIFQKLDVSRQVELSNFIAKLR